MVDGRESNFLSVPVLDQHTEKLGKSLQWVPFPSSHPMSRCFPFPPPGYENKARPEDANLLNKENPKEKKHKKEEKNRDQKEGKDKKDRDKSEEKQREKKDRKDKHKHKKDKNKGKEKKRTSDDKESAGISECYDSELGPNCSQSSQTEILLGFGKRIKSSDGAKEGQTVSASVVSDQRLAESPKMGVASSIGSVPKGNGNSEDRREEYRKVNGQTIKAEATVVENGFVHSFTDMGQREAKEVVALVDQYFEKRMDGNEVNKPRHNNSEGDRRENRDQEQKSKSTDKKREKEKAEEEKTKMETKQLKLEGSKNNTIHILNIESDCSWDSSKNSRRVSNLGRRKEGGVNGVLHDNNFRPSKLLKPLPFSHQVVENGRKLVSPQTISILEQEKLLEANKIISSHQVLKNGNKLEHYQEPVKIALEWHEMTKEHGIVNKISSPRVVVNNQRKVHPCQLIIQSASERLGTVSNHMVDKKDLRINGITHAQPLNIGPLTPPSTPVQLKGMAKPPVKPPHPDVNYLSQILSIPKVEWSNFDDQEWLFSNDKPSEKNSKEEPTGSEETKQVWSEAVLVKSAEFVALPYVIPY